MTESNLPSLGQFDIGIDKGTLDAILLCSSDQRKTKREAYVDTVHRHIKNYLFLISCNWTQNELLEFFAPSKFYFLIIYKIKYFITFRIFIRT